LPLCPKASLSRRHEISALEQPLAGGGEFECTRSGVAAGVGVERIQVCQVGDEAKENGAIPLPRRPDSHVLAGCIKIYNIYYIPDIYEGSKAKSGNIAQQLDLLPETSKKLFKFNLISRNVKICILNVFTQKMKQFSFRKVHFFWLLIYFICPKC
jgi:hypothetical protein